MGCAELRRAQLLARLPTAAAAASYLMFLVFCAKQASPERARGVHARVELLSAQGAA